MKGGHHLSGDKQFGLVYEKGRSWAGREIVLRALPNGLELPRFGFVVSRRIGKAVVRNRIKRRLREIVRQMPVPPGWDIILIARIPAAAADFTGLNVTVRRLFIRAGLIIGENEGNSPADD